MVQNISYAFADAAVDIVIDSSWVLKNAGLNAEGLFRGSRIAISSAFADAGGIRLEGGGAHNAKWMFESCVFTTNKGAFIYAVDAASCDFEEAFRAADLRNITARDVVSASIGRSSGNATMSGYNIFRDARVRAVTPRRTYTDTEPGWTLTFSAGTPTAGYTAAAISRDVSTKRAKCKLVIG